MTVSTTEHFVSLLEQSNLLTAEQLESARRELATAGDEQLPRIVERIVARGWVTGW